MTNMVMREDVCQIAIKQEGFIIALGPQLFWSLLGLVTTRKVYWVVQ